MGITMQIYNTYICPSTNALMDLGAGVKQWKDLYIDGLAYIDGLGHGLDCGDFNLSSIGILYGIDSNISIDMSVDGNLTLGADTLITLSGPTTITGALTCSSNLTISTKNIITDTTTGTQIGTGATQKLGFWGVTPVVQQAHITDPTESGASLDEAVTAILLALEIVGILASS